MGIAENVKRILAEIPDYVELEAAAKTRTASEIEEAIRAGVKIIGENYISEFKKVYPGVKLQAKWHFIGSTRKQKHDLLRKKILSSIDMIETVDSFEIAQEIDKKCANIPKVMPILIEINSAREPQKDGVYPDEAIECIKAISELKWVKVIGLMTMGPNVSNPEEIRPYFSLVHGIFEQIKKENIPGVEMRYLSMGMTDSYKIAIEEGANLIRIGSAIFGPRACSIKQ